MGHFLKIILISYLFILLVIAIDFKFKSGMWRELLISSLLSLIQLFTVALVILYLLKLKITALDFGVVLLFFFNASLIAYRRLKPFPYSTLKTFSIIFLSISAISTFSLFSLYLAGILKPTPTSLIPLAGIVTAAGMRSLSLAFRYFKRRLFDLQDILLGMFALGATDLQVFGYVFRNLIDDITVPVRDMFRSAGIVHIPGVMVGLLLSGVFPLKAAAVQFAVLSTMVFQFTFTPAVALFFLVSLFGLKIYPGGENE